MSMSGYTKLFNSILASTIWRESHTTRIVWITLLAMADKHGVAEGSVPGLADFARVSIPECRKALAALMSPDEDSRSKEYDGRRLAVTEGGWQLLNHAKYRQKMGADERREYLRQKQAEYRRRLSIKVNKVSDTSTLSTHTKAEAEANTEVKDQERALTRYSPEFERAWSAYPRKVGKPKASAAWKKLHPPIDAVLSALEWQTRQPQWVKDGGEFIPHMATWLNQRRWEDEPPISLKVGDRFTVADAGAEDWFEECGRLHQHECGSRYIHGLRVSRESPLG